MLAMRLISSRSTIHVKAVVTYKNNSTIIAAPKGGPKILIGE